MTAPLNLDHIRSIHAGITPGDWEMYDANDGEWPPRPMWCVANDAFHNPSDNEDAPWMAVEIHTGCKADAAFIAAAPSMVAHLLGIVERVEGVLARLGEEAANAEVGERNAAEADNGAWLMALQSERYAYEQTVRWLRAAITGEGGA